VLDTMDAAPGQTCESCNREVDPGEVLYGHVDEDRCWGDDPFGLLDLHNGGPNSDFDLKSGRQSSGWICQHCYLATEPG